ncbi:MAG: glycosyltransferase [Paracoccaceae bacterium]
MSAPKHIAFLGTSRSGLGHLRRIANIAGQVVRRDPNSRLTLLTNAEPAGLSHAEGARFSQIIVCEKTEMSAVMATSQVTLAVADTMTLPGIGAYRGQSVLILRETPRDRLERFRRDDGKAWDCVIVPNTAEHWMPSLAPGFASRVAAVGWVLRPSGSRRPGEKSAGIVLATGGGGTADTRAGLYPLLTKLLKETRARSRKRFRIRQALGPRASCEMLEGADVVFEPGADLNAAFRQADLVISTAGYNSVLELASTDTPAMIVPIPRSLDDQAARVRLWGPRLGFGLLPDRIDAAADWLADQLDRPRRRPAVDLGPDGAERTANILLDMMCPAS